MYIKQITNNYQNYSFYNVIENTYFGMLSYIMLNLIANKPIRPMHPVTPKEPRKPSKRISARQVQNNLDSFIKEQRQVNKILLEFIAEQREFNKLVVSRLDKIDTRIDNLVVKNNLTE